MNQKYEFVENDTKTSCDGHTLKRIRALVAIGILASPGDLGGYIEAEANLSVSGNAWVFGDAEVSGNAEVSGDARVFGDAEVSGDARVFGDAEVSGDARVSGNAEVSGNARVSGNAEVSGNARVSGNAEVMWFSRVGSENGTLTAYRGKDNTIIVTRGCFLGTVEEFEAAVARRHGDSKVGLEYKLLVQVIQLRLAK